MGSQIARPADWLVLSALLVTLLLVAVVTIGQGYDWGDDFALYIAHARNIVLDYPYAETGYIYNPNFSIAGPPTYPPGLPLLLGPVYALFGLDLYTMKLTVFVFFIASLLMIFLTARAMAGPIIAWIVLLIVAASPRMWDLRNSILSEFPFMFFLYSSLWLLSQDESAGVGVRQAPRLLATALSIFMCFATRVVGGVLLVAMIMSVLWDHRRLRGDHLVITAGVGALATAQYLWLGSVGEYGDLLSQTSVATVAKNATMYVGYLFWFFTLGGRDSLNEPLLVLYGGAIALSFAGLAAAGLLARLTGGAGDKGLMSVRLGVTELFLFGYLAAVIVMPYLAARYLLPIFPLLVLYACIGARELAKGFKARPAIGPAALALAVGLIYLPLYPQLERSSIQQSVLHADCLALFDYIREQTDKNAVVIFARPRLMALFGERHSTIWPQNEGPAEAWRYIGEIGGTHLAVGRRGYGRHYPAYLRDETDLARRGEVVFDNEAFVVYRLHQGTHALQPTHSRSRSAPAASVSSSGRDVASIGASRSASASPSPPPTRTYSAWQPSIVLPKRQPPSARP